MNHLGRNLIFCSTLLSLGSVANIAQAAPDLAGASAAGLRGAASAITTRAQALNNPSELAPSVAAPSSDDAEPVAAEEAAKPNPCQVPTLKDGSYIGAQFGYGTYRIRNDVVFPFTLSPVNANTNWSYGANIGYGKMLTSMFYLGGELFAVANTMDEPFTADDRSGFTYTNVTSVGPTYGFGLLPGVRITHETLTYVRLGVNRVIMKTDETATLAGVGSATSSASKIKYGFVFGLGMETLITTNYSLRGEFDHMFISSYSTGSFNTKVSPSNNLFTMSVIYHAD